MNRRDALQALAAAAGGPLLGVEPLERLIEIGSTVHGSIPVDGAPLQALDGGSAATARVLAEIILPRTDTPGATDARVVEFLDTLLAGWMEPADRESFVAGLAAVDAAARARHGAAFADLEPADQIAMVAEMDAEVAELLRQDRAGPADEYIESPDDRPPPRAPAHFFYQMKRWTLVGYFTSRPGMTETLRYNPFPGLWDPCRVLEESR